MRKILLFLCFYALISNTFAQSQIKGIVTDSQTKEPLIGASVFLNNTTIGVATDKDGKFTLKNVQIGTVDLVVSFIGYQNAQQRVELKENQDFELKIILQPLAQELQGVEISAEKDKVWKRNLNKFEKIFLGKTPNVSACKILNSWTLDFLTDDEKDILTATASLPVEVENRALGYKVSFYLKRFFQQADEYSILGNARFEALSPKDEKERKKWENNRKLAYFCSDRYLLKSIIKGKAQERGFVLYKDKEGAKAPTRTPYFSKELGKSIVEIKPQEISIQQLTPHSFKIFLPKRVEVHYTQEKAIFPTYLDNNYQVSWLSLKANEIEVYQNGLLKNPLQVYTSGYMGNLRIADMLPLDYEPDGEKTFVEPIKNQVASTNELLVYREKAYLHTDRPYYFVGEPVWFKAYLQYTNPNWRDSLSNVLYVELISPELKVLQRKKLKISDGVAIGEFILPDKRKGEFYLRAYTNLMRNFGSTDFALNKIPVLSEKENLPSRREETTKSGFPISLIPFQTIYKKREKITLQIQTFDEENKPATARLSASVINANIIQSIEKQQNILSLANWGDIKKQPTEIKFPLEIGMTLQGKVVNKKQEGIFANLLLLNTQTKESFGAMTDEKGRFLLTGLNFQDSAAFAVQALGRDSQPAGKVQIDSLDLPSLEIGRDSAIISYREVEVPIETDKKLRFGEDVRQLKAVTVVEKKLEKTEEIQQKLSVTRMYGQPDYVVTDKDLNVVTVGNPLMALQGRVPGIQIIEKIDATGFMQYTVRIRGGNNSLMRASEPLVLLDGILLNSSGDGGMSPFMQLSAIPLANIDRIEVVTRATPLYGSRGTNGIIAVYTKSSTGNLNDKNLSNAQDGTNSLKSTSIINLQGFTTPLAFPLPDYSSIKEENIKPDGRITLYWNPTIRTDANGKAEISFYANDIAGMYRMEVEGILSNGKVGRAIIFLRSNK